MNAQTLSRSPWLIRLGSLLLFFLCSTPPSFGQTKFSGSGTGFFIASNGLLVTAAHVVRDQEKIMVLYAGKLTKAEVVKTDTVNDLALLKVDRSPVAFLRIARSDNIPVGLEVYAIGYPQVNVQGLSPKFTAGIINSNSGLKGSTKHFQFSAEIQRGNSGGPLLGTDGSVVGIVLSKLGMNSITDIKMDLPQNVNYALKSNLIMDLVNELDEIPASLSINPKSDKRPFEIYRDSVMSVVPVFVTRAASSN